MTTSETTYSLKKYSLVVALGAEILSTACQQESEEIAQSTPLDTTVTDVATNLPLSSDIDFDGFNYDARPQR
ncbi:MAG: hypothetical protein ACI9H8_001487 [Lysobacterales bacterium]